MNTSQEKKREQVDSTPDSRIGPSVLVRRGWPNGFCPVHVFEVTRCASSCMPHRVAIALLQEAYDEYWRTHAIDLAYERKVA